LAGKNFLVIVENGVNTNDATDLLMWTFPPLFARRLPGLCGFACSKKHRQLCSRRKRRREEKIISAEGLHKSM